MTPEEIKKFRRWLKMTQEDFARRLGVTQNSVSNWELGKVQPSRLGRIVLRRVASEEKFLSYREKG